MNKSKKSNKTSKGQQKTGNDCVDNCVPEVQSLGLGNKTTAEDVSRREQISSLQQQINRLQEHNNVLTTTTQEQLRKIERLEGDSELLRTLLNASQNGIQDTNVQQIHQAALKQRKELSRIYEVVERQTLTLKSMQEAVRLGQCATCAARNSAPVTVTSSAQVITPQQCVDDLEHTERNENSLRLKVVLLNSGQTKPMSDLTGSVSRNDTGVHLSVGSTRRAISDEQDGHISRHYQTDNADRQLPLVGADSVQLNEDTNSPAGVLICPICTMCDFISVDALQLHVDAHFPERNS